MDSSDLCKPSKSQWSLYVPPVYHSTILRSAHTLYLCVLCGSQNKQLLFPYTALTGLPKASTVFYVKHKLKCMCNADTLWSS